MIAVAANGTGRSLYAGNPITNLRPQHPRLYRDAAGFEMLKSRVTKVEPYRTWYAKLQRDAEEMLTAPPLEHSLDGFRMLAQCRFALDRISLLAGLYRLDGDPRKARRARQEMLTAAAFPDWNPKHFLDTAEMTHAMAIGYDWLYDELSDTDRTTVRRAIIEKGLLPGQGFYFGRKGWTRRNNNWNQVCNAGLTIGALAIADEEPVLARSIIENGRVSIVRAMRAYSPDGGYAEGPMYWDYGTRYNIFYLAALETALGTDFGLLRRPGFSLTGDFRMQSVGPTGLPFSYADARESLVTAPQMLWLARRFQRPDFASHEEQFVGDRPDIFHLIWSSKRAGEEMPERTPSALFRGIDVAFLRSDWSPSATYVGFKAGSNRVDHSHLDLGSFVLDSQGVRWAIDLGGDDYNLPRYFGSLRWTYFRTSNLSHNTLTIDDDHQDPKASARIVAFQSRPGRAFAVADLSAAYANKLQSVRRLIAMIDNKHVLIQDELADIEPVSVKWNMFTRAHIVLQGRRAKLAIGDAKLHAFILSPDDAVFQVAPADAPAPETQQPGVHSLRVAFSTSNEDQRVAVLLSPDENGSDAVQLNPIEDWISSAVEQPKQ